MLGCEVEMPGWIRIRKAWIAICSNMDLGVIYGDIRPFFPHLLCSFFQLFIFLERHTLSLFFVSVINVAVFQELLGLFTSSVAVHGPLLVLFLYPCNPTHKASPTHLESNSTGN